MLRSKRLNWRGLLLLSTICLLTATSVFALELEMSVSGGYDDNPHLEKGSEGAAFTESEINIWWTMPLPGYPSTAITLFSFAAYQLYDGLDDNWRLGGGVTTSTPLPELPCSLEFFADIAAYRNPLIDDNEFDNLSLGGRLIWFAGPRLNLEFEANLSWEDYCQAVTAGSQTNSGHSLNGSANGDRSKNPQNSQNLHVSHETGHPKHHNLGDRNDQLIATALKAFYALTPYLDGGSEFFWRRRHSSIDAEKRSTYGLGVNLNWHPSPPLEFIWSLSGKRIPYKYDYQKEEHTDKIYTSEISASWRWGSWSISGIWSWSKRDSVINEDNYRHNSWQSRLTYSY